MVSIESIIIVIGLVIVGGIISGILERVALRLYRAKYKTRLEKPVIARLISSIVFLFFILLALSYLQIQVNFDLLFNLSAYIPAIVSVFLLFVSALLFTRIVMLILDIIFRKAGLVTLIRGYGQISLYKLGQGVFGTLLFLFFFGQVLQLAGYDVGAYMVFLQFLTYPILLLFFLLVFIALKDIVKDLGAGVYIKATGLIRPGHYLNMDEKEYKVSHLKLVGITAETKQTSTFIPYHRLLEGHTINRTKTPLETLEDIKDQFVAQSPSYCGPASASMLLKMFGFSATQEEIGEMAKTEVSKKGEPAGTKPEDLIRAVEAITKKKVRGVWIDADHIVDLKSEVKAWIDGDALLMVDYKKSYLFPKAAKAHYSLCLGINGDELLILDPSPTAGGVFYADYRKVLAGMDTFSPLFNGKRGYLVFALDGTPAFKQIEEGIIYFSPSMYHKLTKQITIALEDLEEKTKKLESVFPKRLAGLVGKEKVARLWKPN